MENDGSRGCVQQPSSCIYSYYVSKAFLAAQVKCCIMLQMLLP